MQEYRVICKSDRGFLNAVLAAAREDTMLEIKESQRELVIPEFEAYRTGIPEIRKVLKRNDVMLRAQYFDYSDNNYTIKDETSLISTGTAGNLRKIDTAYRKGAYLNSYLFLSAVDRAYIYNDFRIVFLGNDRIPTLRYKPTYTKRQPVDLSIREFIEVYHGYAWQFGLDNNRLEELKALCRLLPKLVKYSP